MKEKMKYRLNLSFAFCGYCNARTNEKKFSLKQGRSVLRIECGLLWFLI